MSREVRFSIIFALLVLLTRSLVFIFTPLYLDSLTPTTAPLLNITNDTNGTDLQPVIPSSPQQLQIDPVFVIVFSMGFDTFILAVMLLLLKLIKPNRITERETQTPKKRFFIAGAAQGISSSVFLFACSGSRTAPYLQAVLGNFHIPITFSLRFLILKKRPTLRKLLCASAVAGAEFITLIPTIFPSLENSGAHSREGGSTGIGRVLWPLCYVASMLPAAVSNIAQEQIYKEEQKKNTNDKAEKINMIYALFWTYFFIFLTTVLLFWTDFIPGYGTSSNFYDFCKKMVFNLKCVFGAEDACTFPVPFFAWGRMISKTMNVLVSAFLLKYGEGANFLVIILAMRTPVVFLFWSMFNEHPFQWEPHSQLSTWLSIGAIFVMLPTMVLYQTGAPEVSLDTKSRAGPNDELPEERRQLITNVANESSSQEDE